MASSLSRRAGLAGAGLAGAAAAWLAANRVAVRWMQRAEDSVAAGDLDLPTDVVERWVTLSDGGAVRVLERGDGTPVVLLHGVTLSAAVWA
ncbi:MAG: hypothetical protein ACRDYY_15150, partial [Acidimicrobiales bacterium]